MTIKFCFQRQNTIRCYMPFPLPNLLDVAANFTPHLILGVLGILDQVLVIVEQRQNKKIINPSNVITHSSSPALHPELMYLSSMLVSGASNTEPTTAEGKTAQAATHFSRPELSAGVHKKYSKNKIKRVLPKGTTHWGKQPGIWVWAMSQLFRNGNKAKMSPHHYLGEFKFP